MFGVKLIDKKSIKDQMQMLDFNRTLDQLALLWICIDKG